MCCIGGKLRSCHGPEEIHDSRVNPPRFRQLALYEDVRVRRKINFFFLFRAAILPEPKSRKNYVIARSLSTRLVATSQLACALR